MARLNVQISDELAEAMRAFSKDTGIPQAVIVRTALERDQRFRWGPVGAALRRAREHEPDNGGFGDEPEEVE